MPKRQLSAKELLQDIRAGMDDTALMEKYQLSAQGLQGVFKKLVAAGGLKQEELDGRASDQERTVNLAWKCPACGKPQHREFEECPDCGVIFGKLKQIQFANESGQVGSEAHNHSDSIISVFSQHKSVIALACSVVLLVVIGIVIHSIRANSLQKRQLAMENELRIQKENKLREESETAQRQEQFRQKEARLQEQNKKVEEGTAAQLVKGQKDSEQFLRSYNQQVRSQAQAEEARQEERKRTELTELARLERQKRLEEEKKESERQFALARQRLEEAAQRQRAEAAAVGVSCSQVAANYQQLIASCGSSYWCKKNDLMGGIAPKNFLSRCREGAYEVICLKCLNNRGEIVPITIQVSDEFESTHLSSPGYCKCNND